MPTVSGNEGIINDKVVQGSDGGFPAGMVSEGPVYFCPQACSLQNTAEGVVAHGPTHISCRIAWPWVVVYV